MKFSSAHFSIGSCSTQLKWFLFSPNSTIKRQTTSSLLKCFIMTLTMKDRVLLLKFFYKKDECALTAIRRFRTLKSIKSGPITTNGLRKMIAKFEETGSFDVKWGRGRKPIWLRQWKMWLQHYENRRAVTLESAVHG